jgi:hypothetical protein
MISISCIDVCVVIVHTRCWLVRLPKAARLIGKVSVHPAIAHIACLRPSVVHAPGLPTTRVGVGVLQI